MKISERNYLRIINISDYAIVFLCFFLLLLICLHKIYQNNLDIWYLLKTGEYIIQTKILMWQDVFSWSVQGHANSMHEWLSAVVFYLTYNYFSFTGLIILKTIICLSTLFVLFKTLRLFRLPLFLSCLLPLTFLYFADLDFYERPQIFTYLGLALTFYFLEKFVYEFRNDNKINDSLWQNYLAYFLPLSLLFFIWSNLHSGIMAGTGLVLLYLIFLVLRVIWEKYFKSKAIPRLLLELKVLVVGFLSVLFFSLLNPNTYKIYTYYFEIDPAEAAKFVSEWGSIFTIMTPQRVLFLVITGLVLLYLFILLVSKKCQLQDFIIVVLFTYLAVTSMRHLPLLAICLPVYVGKYFSANGYLKIKNKRIKEFFLILSFIMLVVLYARFLSNKQIGLGVEWDVFPNKAADFVIENKIKGRMYNDYDNGGFLIWKFYPENQVFIDGRFDLYVDNEVYPDYRQIMFNQALLPEKITKYDFDFFIIPHWIGKIRLLERLLNDYQEQYAWVYYDDNFSVFIKRTEENKAVIDQYELSYIYPSKVYPIRGEEINQDNLNMAEEEYLRLLSSNPVSVDLRFSLAKIYVSTGRGNKAREQYFSALNYMPVLINDFYLKSYRNNKIATIYNEIANTYIAEENYDLAAKYLKEGIENSPGSAFLYKNLADNLIKQEKFSEARVYYDKYENRKE